MDNRHMKRCSASWTIKEMQFKTAMRCHLTPVRMTVFKETINNSLVRMQRKGSHPGALLVGV